MPAMTIVRDHFSGHRLAAARSMRSTRCFTARAMVIRMMVRIAVVISIGMIDQNETDGRKISARCSRCQLSQRHEPMTPASAPPASTIWPARARIAVGMTTFRARSTRRTRRCSSPPIPTPNQMHSAPTAPCSSHERGSIEGRNDSHHISSAATTEPIRGHVASRRRRVGNSGAVCSMVSTSRTVLQPHRVHRRTPFVPAPIHPNRVWCLARSAGYGRIARSRRIEIR